MQKHLNTPEEVEAIKQMFVDLALGEDKCSLFLCLADSINAPAMVLSRAIGAQGIKIMMEGLSAQQAEYEQKNTPIRFETTNIMFVNDPVRKDLQKMASRMSLSVVATVVATVDRSCLSENLIHEVACNSNKTPAQLDAPTVNDKFSRAKGAYAEDPWAGRKGGRGKHARKRQTGGFGKSKHH